MKSPNACKPMNGRDDMKIVDVGISLGVTPRM